MIDSAPSRTLDPLQSVLAHLPDGMYGTYEGLSNHMLLDPIVPMDVKEGLRFVSAVMIGCEFCRTFREVDRHGAGLLPEDFYLQVADGDPNWDEIAPARWIPVFEMAVEVLTEDGRIAPATLARLKATLSDAQIVEALFYMLLIGASHRFSHALGIEAACAVPARVVSGATQGSTEAG